MSTVAEDDDSVAPTMPRLELTLGELCKTLVATSQYGTMCSTLPIREDEAGIVHRYAIGRILCPAANVPSGASRLQVCGRKVLSTVGFTFAKLSTLSPKSGTICRSVGSALLGASPRALRIPSIPRSPHTWET